MIRTLTVEDHQAWSNYVAIHQNTTPFHSPLWGEVLKRAYGYTNVSLGSFDHGKLNGLLPLYRVGSGNRSRYQSSPWGDYAGPLTDTPTIATALLERASILVGSQELIIMTNVPSPKSSLLYSSHPYRSFRLKVDRPFTELCTKVIHQKTRNMINKARRSEILTNSTPLSQAIKPYYSLYYDTMIRLRQLPFDRRFFTILGEVFKHDAMLFISSWHEHPVAGLITLRFGDTLFIWGNASDRDALNGSNNAVYAAALEHACEDPAITWVDFGSTVPDTSHHRFKQRWGGLEYKLFRLSNRPSTNSGSSKILRLLPYLPPPVVRTLARLAYRYY